MIRAARAMSVQVEGPARVAYNTARTTQDNIRRVEHQARLQRDLQARAIAATRPRGRSTLPDDELKQKLQEAEVAGKRAADLSKQAERMTAEHKGKVEQTKAALDAVAAAIAASNEDGKLAHKLGDQFRQLADGFENQVAALQPREDSEAGLAASRFAAEVDSVNGLAEKIEALALRINPNLHTPSETEVFVRQADEALEKAAALLGEEAEINSGPHPDDLLAQISAAQQSDSTVRDELARAEQKLRGFQALDALPEPDPNPERARKAIASAAGQQSRVIAPVVAAGESLVRAALHEQRLGHRANARELGRIARRVHAFGMTDLSARADQLRTATRVMASTEIADGIEKSIRTEMHALRVFLFPEADVATRIAETDEQHSLPAELLSVRESEVSAHLARVLFQVQKQVPGKTLLAQLELSEQGTQAAVERDVEVTESPPPVAELVRVQSPPHNQSGLNSHEPSYSDLPPTDQRT